MPTVEENREEILLHDAWCMAQINNTNPYDAVARMKARIEEAKAQHGDAWFTEGGDDDGRPREGTDEAGV